MHVLVDAAAGEAGEGGLPRWALVEAARQVIASRRAEILAGPEAGGNEAGGNEAGDGDAGLDAGGASAAEVVARARQLVRPALRRVINATGVVLHTNLGRAPLAAPARAAIDAIAAGYSNLEYDLERGARGSRHDHLRGLIRELTGAEDAVVANNNAAATVLGLAALAAGKEVIVSRGELIEIGGSFRLPEILALSGGTLVEVGTTNKTHARDYAAAITPGTGLLLKVHRSNFAIVGFTAEVEAGELVALGRARGVPTMIDLGSGALVDRATQRRWGLPDEPSVADAVASGADLVTFSGDKLLGGPQAGLAVGRAAAVERARKHPLMRALRPDKLTLAGLEATLALYRDRALDAIPTTRMLGTGAAELRARAEALVAGAGTVRGVTLAVEPCRSAVGGGAMPTAELASWAITLAGPSADRLDAQLRRAAPPVIGRIEGGRVWLDVRTVAPEEGADLVAAIQALAPGA
ncbi:MAG TPA: L-seryl-tRNA(Sec) selenium transferase [Kofleriaceae bacterium]